MQLPKVSFFGNYRSIFTFKREPKPEYISTIETCYYLNKELQSTNIVPESDPECLMTAFKELIKLQIQKENDRIEGKIPNTHATDFKYHKLKEMPKFD